MENFPGESYSEAHHDSPDQEGAAKELEDPKLPGRMVVDLVRHGKTEYTDKPPDLTPEGQEQMRAIAERLAPEIDPENERLVIWHSPTVRAEGSAKIIREELERLKRPVAKQSAVKSMRMMDIKDAEHLDRIFSESFHAGMTEGQLIKDHPIFSGDTNEKVETLAQMQRRKDRILNGLRYAFEHVHTDSRRLRVIGISHFEILQPLIWETLGATAEDMAKGEKIRLTFFRVPTTTTDGKPFEETRVLVSFHDRTAGPFRFDHNSRQLVLVAPEST